MTAINVGCSLREEPASVRVASQNPAHATMAKRHKTKARRGERTSSAESPGADVAQQKPKAPQDHEPAESRLTPNPPRRNPLLLTISLILLAVWLVVLLWLAVAART